MGGTVAGAEVGVRRGGEGSRGGGMAAVAARCDAVVVGVRRECTADS